MILGAVKAGAIGEVFGEVISDAESVEELEGVGVEVGVGHFLDAVAGELGVAGDVKAIGEGIADAPAFVRLRRGNRHECRLGVEAGYLGFEDGVGGVDDLGVEIARGDDEDGAFGDDEERRARSARPTTEEVESDFEQGPGEDGEAFAEAGVVSEDEAVVQGGAGIVLELEVFEFHNWEWTEWT